MTASVAIVQREDNDRQPLCMAHKMDNIAAAQPVCGGTV